MDALIWPAWIEISAGGLGLAWAISTFTKPPRNRADHINRWGLLFFSILLVLVGAIRWVPQQPG